MAGWDSYLTWKDSNATTSQKIGSTVQAVYKGALVVFQTTPIVGLGLGVLDMAGFSPLSIHGI